MNFTNDYDEVDSWDDNEVSEIVREVEEWMDNDRVEFENNWSFAPVR